MPAEITTLNDQERDFLLEGTRTAKLGYTAGDGRPLIAPVWFTIDDGDITFCTGATTAKGRSLQRDGRVVVVVDLEAPPYAFVQVQGVVEYVDNPAEALRISTIVGGRYMGDDRADEFGKRNGVPGELTVRVKATKIISHFNMAG
jgi:PPOX class probable F420-dependent enzyme